MCPQWSEHPSGHGGFHLQLSRGGVDAGGGAGQQHAADSASQKKQGELNYLRAPQHAGEQPMAAFSDYLERLWVRRPQCCCYTEWKYNHAVAYSRYRQARQKNLNVMKKLIIFCTFFIQILYRFYYTLSEIFPYFQFLFLVMLMIMAYR